MPAAVRHFSKSKADSTRRSIVSSPQSVKSSSPINRLQKAVGNRVTIKIIEGLNPERLEVGMAFPVMLHDEGKPAGEGKFGTVILQVTKKTATGNRTTVEFKSLQEAWTDQKAGKATRTLGGKTYIVTHPY